MGTRIAVFAHYDADREIKPYVVRLVRGLREVVDRVLFYSTAPALDPLARSRLEGITEPPVVVDNRGYDFGMWSQALATLSLDDVDELVLANSSVVGPLWPLQASFDQMAERACDFWSMTDSFELKWHLQSYFLVFRRRALAHPALRRFFGSVLPYRDKSQVILSYELGLTAYLEEAGLVGEALVPAAELWRQVGSTTGGGGIAFRANPTIHFPQALLQRRMPFVKIETLRDNPGAAELTSVFSAMAHAGYDPRDLGARPATSIV